MADFSTSTHRARWIFSPQELKEKFKAANQSARQALEKYLSVNEGLRLQRQLSQAVWEVGTVLKYGATIMQVDAEGSWSYVGNQTDMKDNGEKHSRPKHLKTDDERLLRAFYEFKIQDTCSAFSFPRKIQATALIFFKRFYLQWSVMDHHPKDIMLTCIYAACKAEENHVSAEELGKGIDQDHRVILDLEMLVLQSLGFDLIVYAPYRPLEGFFNILEDFIQANDEQIQVLKDMHETAKELADKIMRTDAPLLFPPGQLALAALRRSNEERGRLFDFESFLGSLVSPQHPNGSISELNASLNAIDSLLGKLETPTADDMKHIARKLKSCRDPSSHDKSKKRKHRSKDASQEMRS